MYVNEELVTLIWGTDLAGILDVLHRLSLKRDLGNGSEEARDVRQRIIPDHEPWERKTPDA